MSIYIVLCIYVYPYSYLGTETVIRILIHDLFYNAPRSAAHKQNIWELMLRTDVAEQLNDVYIVHKEWEQAIKA